MKTIKLPLGWVLHKPQPKTAIHPEYKRLVEFAFEIDGVKYYEFKNLGDMPTMRFKKFQDFSTQCDWRMSIDDIQELIVLQEKAINKQKITDIVKINDAFKYCMTIYLETDLFMQLFSCLFFTMDENLEDYDYDIGAKKIEAFSKHGVPDFFLKEPIKRYLPLTTISKQDFEVFSKQTDVKRDFLQSIKKNVLQSVTATD